MFREGYQRPGMLLSARIRYTGGYESVGSGVLYTHEQDIQA